MNNARAFDTLHFSKKMVKAGFTQKQAEGQAEAFIEIIDNNLATKHDIALIQKDIKVLEVKIESINSKTNIILWVIGATGFITIFTQALKLFGF